MATPDNDMATPDKDMATSGHETTREDKPARRRITTTLLTPRDASVVARPVPTAIAFPPLGASEGTRPPAWAKRSLLEKRMGSTSAATPSAVWGPQAAEQQSVWGKPQIATPVVKEVATKTLSTATRPKQLQMRKKPTSNQVTHLQDGRGSKVMNQEGLKIMKTSVKSNEVTGPSADDFQVNKQAAKLYGFLIRERFVKSTCAELEVLISLLYRADCAMCSRNKKPETPTGCDNKAAEPSCGETSEFCWRSHCLEFAEIVFHEIEPVLEHLGADLLRLVKHSLRDAEGICSSMLERLDEFSRRREELRVAESARIGCQLPVEMKASTVRDFALPFNEETDSRLHYRTPAESLLYTNREKVRDGFLSLLRQFQQKQHSLVGIENANVAAATIAAARELLGEVSPENRWWFAKFFVQELIQVGSNPFGESDKDLVLKIMEDKLVIKNPDRLRKLHRRFSSQNKSPQPHIHSGSLNGSSNRTNGKGSNNTQRKTRLDSRTTNDDATKIFTATLDRMRDYFTDNQLFFFHFLHSCDSYEFSELVKHQLERQFYAIRAATSPSGDARKDFTEVVLRLKVVAKFLGYLRFSPQWQVTSSIQQLSSQNAAFKAVEREGINTLEVARDSSLDVKKLLEDSILQSSISKCIPWLCDYLTMLSLDKLSLGTTYFKQLVVLLQLLYRSPLLTSLGETGLCIAMQIERIFHLLKLDVGYLHGEEFHSQNLLPLSHVRLALEKKHDISPEDSEPGEDSLPFLYSQVFVQSCVSELEDLRGFIQTRAQATPRRKLSIGSGLISGGQPVAPIRKLRPLQVVIEDGHTVGNFSSFAAKNDTAVHAPRPGMKLTTTGFLHNFPPVHEGDDKLSEAVFKVHPRLKTVVEFVVGTVTTDVCEHVMVHVVTPRADALVDRCAAESSLLVTAGSSTAAIQDDDAASGARASFQMLITSKTRYEVNFTVVAALQEALRLGEDRVSAAVPPFMPPSSHSTLTKSIVFVALQRTRGALKTLVPKSCQTEFVKRVAFRNKSLLKSIGSASKVQAITLPSTAVNPEKTLKVSIDFAGETSSADSEQKDPQASIIDQQFRLLKRWSSAVSKSANCNESMIPSLTEWERQTTTLLSDVLQFTSILTDHVTACGELGKFTSPLNVETLITWDTIWRSVTSCLKFLQFSLDVFAGCELRSMKEARVDSVEHTFTTFVTRFSTLLDATVRFIGKEPTDSTASSRLQSMIVLVIECVMQLPRRRNGLFHEHGTLMKRFDVSACSTIVSSLRTVTENTQLNLDWRRWIEQNNLSTKTAFSTEAQFRLDVRNAVSAAATALQE
ncbi:unnamed protein product [Phytophthora lilii]|uniref:Unnamed protein product n=1 Tax=Phytophthora lilii TaxID=2077276 RepID=A0A9W6U9F5_9STRA|nr:unnamed protein product [Phytophthora lilii]